MMNEDGDYFYVFVALILLVLFCGVLVWSIAK